MPDDEKAKPHALGFFSPSGREAGIDPADTIALFLSVLWLAIAGAVLFLLDLGGDESGLGRVRFLVALLAVIMPIALIWLAASAVKATRILREEATRLRATIDSMRQGYLQQQQAGEGVHPAVEKRLDEIARAQRQTETVIATFTSRRDHTAGQPASPRRGNRRRRLRAAPKATNRHWRWAHRQRHCGRRLPLRISSGPSIFPRIWRTAKAFAHCAARWRIAQRRNSSARPRMCWNC
ncbi:hypothetical protein RGUI_1438 [Rhodovulum sp. P5]|uniref:hypothetical protein n=1 Tax=Rhodovulum sp. P5 TaxID=1564506 RepID=UPI0009C292EF|nr:hypothetical protein [Rhodovulum sp. P5]ARE39579.1 hypothetical protein RGUI_1438 [Rhodovulum sp. P5]